MRRGAPTPLRGRHRSKQGAEIRARKPKHIPLALTEGPLPDARRMSALRPVAQNRTLSQAPRSISLNAGLFSSKGVAVMRAKELGWLRDNALSILFLCLFLVSLAGQSISGFYGYNGKLAAHHLPSLTYAQYSRTGDFLNGIFCNWQAAVLQLGCLIFFGGILRQKGCFPFHQIRHSSTGKESRASVFLVLQALALAGIRGHLCRVAYCSHVDGHARLRRSARADGRTAGLPGRIPRLRNLLVQDNPDMAGRVCSDRHIPNVSGRSPGSAGEAVAV
jgi:hypothetical protein